MAAPCPAGAGAGTHPVVPWPPVESKGQSSAPDASTFDVWQRANHDWKSGQFFCVRTSVPFARLMDELRTIDRDLQTGHANTSKAAGGGIPIEGMTYYVVRSGMSPEWESQQWLLLHNGFTADSLWPVPRDQHGEATLLPTQIVEHVLLPFLAPVDPAPTATPIASADPERALVVDGVQFGVYGQLCPTVANRNHMRAALMLNCRDMAVGEIQQRLRNFKTANCKVLSDPLGTLESRMTVTAAAAAAATGDPSPSCALPAASPSSSSDQTGDAEMTESGGLISETWLQNFCRDAHYTPSYPLKDNSHMRKFMRRRDNVFRVNEGLLVDPSLFDQIAECALHAAQAAIDANPSARVEQRAQPAVFSYAAVAATPASRAAPGPGTGGGSRGRFCVGGLRIVQDAAGRPLIQIKGQTQAPSADMDDEDVETFVQDGGAAGAGAATVAAAGAGAAGPSAIPQTHEAASRSNAPWTKFIARVEWEQLSAALRVKADETAKDIARSKRAFWNFRLKRADDSVLVRSVGTSAASVGHPKPTSDHPLYLVYEPHKRQTSRSAWGHPGPILPTINLVAVLVPAVQLPGEPLRAARCGHDGSHMELQINWHLQRDERTQQQQQQQRAQCVLSVEQLLGELSGERLGASAMRFAVSWEKLQKEWLKESEKQAARAEAANPNGANGQASSSSSSSAGSNSLDWRASGAVPPTPSTSRAGPNSKSQTSGAKRP